VSRLRNIETIYNDALALQPGERAPFLDRVCGDDSDLRREVESLLAYAPQAETYMATPALQQAAESLAQDGKGTLWPGPLAASNFCHWSDKEEWQKSIAAWIAALIGSSP